MNYRPTLLPKIRAVALTAGVRGLPCCARVSTLLAGHRCAAQATVVGAHVGSLGKGVATKVSDHALVAACFHCHEIIDGRDKRLWTILENEPGAYWQRLLHGLIETQAHMIAAGVIQIEGAELL